MKRTLIPFARLILLELSGTHAPLLEMTSRRRNSLQLPAVVLRVVGGDAGHVTALHKPVLLNGQNGTHMVTR